MELNSWTLSVQELNGLKNVGEDGPSGSRLLTRSKTTKQTFLTVPETDGYMLLAETKPIKPGDYNKQELNVKKSPLNTIPFTDSKGATYANGKEVPFDQKAARYTPYKTVFVPLGRYYWHLSQTNNWFVGWGIGTNVDLLNSLTPYKTTGLLLCQTKTSRVTQKLKNNCKDVLANGEFSFKIKEVQTK